MSNAIADLDTVALAAAIAGREVSPVEAAVETRLPQRARPGQ